MRAQTNLDEHDPQECKDLSHLWGDSRLPQCPEPEFAGGGARVRTTIGTCCLRLTFIEGALHWFRCVLECYKKAYNYAAFEIVILHVRH